MAFTQRLFSRCSRLIRRDRHLRTDSTVLGGISGHHRLDVLQRRFPMGAEPGQAQQRGDVLGFRRLHVLLRLSLGVILRLSGGLRQRQGRGGIQRPAVLRADQMHRHAPFALRGIRRRLAGQHRSAVLRRREFRLRDGLALGRDQRRPQVVLQPAFLRQHVARNGSGREGAERQQGHQPRKSPMIHALHRSMHFPFLIVSCLLPPDRRFQSAVNPEQYSSLITFRVRCIGIFFIYEHFYGTNVDFALPP